jgi:hypothetical protein
MDQQAPSQSKQSISREELLHLLDLEIEMISEQRGKEGWTTWAVLGGLGTLGWFLWEGLIKETIQWENSITLILAFYLTWTAFDCVKEAAGLTSARHSSKRYRHVDPFTFFKSLLNIPVYLALIWFAFRLHEGVSLFAQTVAVFILSVALLAMLTHPVYYYLQTPRSEFIARSIATVISLYAVGGLCIYAAYSYTNHLQRPSLFDLKIAVIIFAALLLIEKLCPLKDATAYQSFVDIRRQLILGTIDTESARRQMGVVIFGMEAGDIYQFELGRFRSKIASLKVTAKDEQDILDEVLKILSNANPIDIKSEHRARRLLETYDRYRRRYEKRYGAVKNDFGRITNRLTQFFFEANRKDIDDVLNTLQASVHEFSEHAKIREDKRRTIAKLLDG